MKKLLTLILFVSTLSIVAQTKKVLFIGNSYTSYNNLPKMVADAAATTGDTLIYDSQTTGGYSLKAHTQNPTVYTKMRSKTWDFVTIQAQSQEPSFPLSQVRTETFPYAKILADSIRRINTCAKPLFYMTWGRKNGDARNCQFASWLCTYEGMDDSLASRYTHMAQVNEGMISPVGKVWRYLRANSPGIDLYISDESHPSAAGSYAAMCAFYTTIFHKDPTAITFNYTLSAANAKTIREAAKLIVFDALSNWNVGKFDPKADFTLNQIKDTIKLTNSSTRSLDYSWTFGDGNSSILQNPTHVYAAIGQYTVKLESKKCGASSSFSKTIDITELSVKDTTNQDTTKNDTNTVSIPELLNVNQFTLVPNPAHKELNISGAGKAIDYHIYNLTGTEVLSGRLEDKVQVIDVSRLENGLYLINIVQDGLPAETLRLVKR